MDSINTTDEIITEVPFLPSLYVISILAKSSSIILEQHENYNKGSYRNKCLVRSNQNNQYLIVPLKKGKHRSQPIGEVEIAYDENWPRVMEHRLQTEYGNYPYYAYYIEEIMAIVHQRHNFLFDLNARLIEYFFHILDISKFRYTTEFIHNYPEQVLDLRAQITPQYFKANPHLLGSIQVEYFSFIPGHSFIEALLSYGPEVRRLVDEIGKSILWKE